MKIKHYGTFKNSLKTLNWEILREDETEKSYFLPYNKADYLLKVEVQEPSYLTESIIRKINISGLNKVFSIGSGIAPIEYQLKKYSEFIVVVSDYNSSILRLKEFNVFDDALQVDALQDSLPIDKNWVVLFPRIDTEFEDKQLSELFAKCHIAGVKHICFIPAELLSFRIIIAEMKNLLVGLIKRKPRVFCGYARSLSSFKKIWGPYYTYSTEQKCLKKIILLDSI